LEINQLFREHPQPVSVASGPTNLRPHVAAVGPTQFRKPLHETGKEGLYLRIAFVPRHEHANPPQPAGLLRPRDHGHAAKPPIPAMNCRRLNGSNCIRLPTASGQHSGLGRIR
jgi:hypothetical protein